MKTVIEMAREAGFTAGELAFMQDNFMFFAALVRADERNSWPAEMEAMERQVNILTDVLAQSRKPLTEEQLDKAGMKLAECMDYPWEHMPEEGKRNMRDHAKAIIEAAHGIKENT